MSASCLTFLRIRNCRSAFYWSNMSVCDFYKSMVISLHSVTLRVWRIISALVSCIPNLEPTYYISPWLIPHTMPSPEQPSQSPRLTDIMQSNAVDWVGPDDPANPLNWPKVKRNMHIVFVSIFTLYAWVALSPSLSLLKLTTSFLVLETLLPPCSHLEQKN